jgi:hypothetical protein
MHLPYWDFRNSSHQFRASTTAADRAGARRYWCATPAPSFPWDNSCRRLSGAHAESTGGEDGAFQLRLISGDLSLRFCQPGAHRVCARGRPEAAREAVTTIGARQLRGRWVGAPQCAQFSPLRSFFLYVLARTHPYRPAKLSGSPSAHGRFQGNSSEDAPIPDRAGTAVDGQAEALHSQTVRGAYGSDTLLTNLPERPLTREAAWRGYLAGAGTRGPSHRPSGIDGEFEFRHNQMRAFLDGPAPADCIDRQPLPRCSGEPSHARSGDPSRPAADATIALPLRSPAQLL